MTELKPCTEQYECPVCASDIEPEYLSMCESEINKIKADAVREAIEYADELSTSPTDWILKVHKYKDKLEQGE